jgi:antitoxin (DNA-binding transcriptional repressor) of toxin-antitoxin stability system
VTSRNDRTELTEMLRRLSRTGGSVTVKLDGEPIARVEPRAAPPAAAPPAPAEDAT